MASISTLLFLGFKNLNFLSFFFVFRESLTPTLPYVLGRDGKGKSLQLLISSETTGFVKNEKQRKDKGANCIRPSVIFWVWATSPRPFCLN